MLSVDVAALAAAQNATADDLDARAEAIIAAMTPHQWIAQMAQINIGYITYPDGSLNEAAVAQCARIGVGAFLNGFLDVHQWRSMISRIQAIYAEHHVAPVLYGLDSLHGANYVHGAVMGPQQINNGATFNPALVSRFGAITARDLAAAGVNWALAPGLDVAQHKRWPRVYETFGEDPYLTSELGVAAVNGIQSVRSVAATFKHFGAYGASATGDDLGTAFVSEYELLNYYTPSFTAAIRAGVLSGMTGYASINDVPMVVNEKMTIDLLRQDMGFDGVLVTDWEDIYHLNFVHHLVNSNMEAVRVAMTKSSVDVSMVPYDASFVGYAESLLKAGKLPAKRFRASAKRVIKLKLRLGLFDAPMHGAEDVARVGSGADRDAALDIARESIVLLQNKQDVLPLRNEPRLFLTGPSVDNIGYLCGGWTWEWQGRRDNSVFPGSQSIRAAFTSMYKDASRLSFLPGIDIQGNHVGNYSSALEKARAAEYTVIVVGEAPYAESFGNIKDAALPAGQLQYIRDIASTGTKVILVLVEGRPRLLNGVADVVHAVIDAMLPCHMGGQAIAEIILGVTNPSGRLSMTYPKDATKDNMVTPYFHRKNGVCVLTGAACPAEWEFGAGLSYTTFEYSSFALSANQLNTSSESLTASVVVTNTGAMAGKEAVLVFLSQGARASGTPETKMLKKFTKVSLAPGQSTTVTFPIGFNDFAIYNGGIGSGLLKSAEAGAYYVGVKPETVCDANTIGPLCQAFAYAPKTVLAQVFHLHDRSSVSATVVAGHGHALSVPKRLVGLLGNLPSVNNWVLDAVHNTLSIVGSGLCLGLVGDGLGLGDCTTPEEHQLWRHDAATGQLRHLARVDQCLHVTDNDLVLAACHVTT
ncbi:hypothetical protein SPRG_06218 [Saprolegnia parasitica CBS 223.65]|uniref:beta-glucosidase n=1 Tax=Saprolegnia parasitica (strain CBS 223.65) TaxID=695850 RepID=A0A067CNU8_SAPPC|nr:hypothetical protein SPRG_06218 [Saprolegnia parasitica CBS 223.65]KDO28171.1 hypothetical protein SPRG_06218 [Saprolegnia parasitica CBS 223.65]|eukprot:XP_012200998.1 hypothetical protein SPRG_06218 [Saprolegnia parasitica CBS 223.65]